MAKPSRTSHEEPRLPSSWCTEAQRRLATPLAGVHRAVAAREMRQKQGRNTQIEVDPEGRELAQSIRHPSTISEHSLAAKTASNPSRNALRKVKRSPRIGPRTAEGRNRGSWPPSGGQTWLLSSQPARGRQKLARSPASKLWAWLCAENEAADEEQTAMIRDTAQNRKVQKSPRIVEICRK